MDSPIAIAFPGLLTQEQREQVKGLWEREFPGRKAIVREGGETVAPMNNEQLDRIEAKLDALLAALAEDEEDPELMDLDGDLFGGERDTGEEL